MATALRLPESLLDPIKDGTYPESEDVIASELESSGIAETLKLLKNSEEELKAEIHQASSGSSSEVDSWIAQARQLQADIEKSRQGAREIVQKYEAGKTLSAKVEDASAKVRLLHSETDYNDHILQILQSISSVVQEVSSVSLTVDNGDLKAASLKLNELENGLRQKLETGTSEQAWSLVQSQLTILRKRILQELQVVFGKFVHIGEESGPALSIREKLSEQDQKEAIGDAHGQLNLEETLEAFDQLGELDHILLRTSKKLSRVLFQPLISRAPLTALARSDDQCLILQTASSRTTAQVIDDLREALYYLQESLPSKARKTLITTSLQHLIPTLVSDWLSATIPLNLQELLSYQDERLKMKGFAEWLSSNGWTEAQQLTSWVDRLPRMWLTKRRIAALDGVRKAFLSYRGETKIVERIEREKVTDTQDPLADTSGWDEWNAEWTQEQEAKDVPKAEEEDVSGWDFDGGDVQGSHGKQSANDDTEAADAWGWEDDEDKPATFDQSQADAKANGTILRKEQSPREIVLKETYTVTEMPERSLDLISQQLEDADALKSESYAWLQGASPSTGLRALPALILAMFRATAPSFYETAMSSGNIHLYNDCRFLAERFKDHMEKASIVNNDDDVAALEKFAKSAYSREMDIQRTVLGDLLDGAQGFASCTEYPFSAECETAITSTIDRIKVVHGEWKMILSHSALLQSTGSLLATVIEKVIKDVEDMEDISEAESQRLTSFCGQISQLDVLFMAEKAEGGPGSEAHVPMTAVYVYNWLRFQYLANILESSLVDIKYLWTEGELSLEFSADEVIDLIKALFADSPHRRNAIAEIRRSTAT